MDALLAAARLSTDARPDVVWLFAGNGRMRPEVEATAQSSQAIQYLGTFPKDENTVFVQTGGSAALFVYESMFSYEAA